MDQIDLMSEALMTYARGVLVGLIPKVYFEFQHSQVDLGESTPTWRFTLTLQGIEGYDEATGQASVMYEKAFTASGTRAGAVAEVFDEVQGWLEQERGDAEAKAKTADDAWKQLTRKGPNLTELWETAPTAQPEAPELKTPRPSFGKTSEVGGTHPIGIGPT
jgi:hypothetical protein